MVASHAWDLLGAHHVGFSTALICRPGNAPLPIAALPPPDFVACDLRELARQLLPTAQGPG